MAGCGSKSYGGVQVATRPSTETMGSSVYTPFGAPSVQRQTNGNTRPPQACGPQSLRTAGQRSQTGGNRGSFSYPLPTSNSRAPCEPNPSLSTCPPHGAKAVCGRRSKMEDAYAIRDDFVAAPDLVLEPMVPPLLPTKHSVSLTSSLDGSEGPGLDQWHDSDDFNNRSDAGPELSSDSSTDSLHFFGVFDGHGGVEAAKHCADRMHQNLSDVWNERIVCGGQRLTASSDQLFAGHCSGSATSLSTSPTSQDVEDVFLDAFIKTDDQFRSDDVSALVGSTAVIVLVGQRYYLVANCGDSRAVLCRSGQAHPLTVDHKPEREDEMARVEKAGGQVWFWNGARVMGVLAMSRAIGDRSLRPYVIPDPEVSIVPRTADDTLIILATDGLWDVVSDQEACTLAMKCLDRAQQKGATEADAARLTATVLIRAAMDRGSRDNITVVVIDLRTSKTARLRADPLGPKYMTGVQIPQRVNGVRDRQLSHSVGAGHKHVTPDEVMA